MIRTISCRMMAIVQSWTNGISLSTTWSWPSCPRLPLLKILPAAHLTHSLNPPDPPSPCSHHQHPHAYNTLNQAKTCSTTTGHKADLTSRVAPPSREKTDTCPSPFPTMIPTGTRQRRGATAPFREPNHSNERTSRQTGVKKAFRRQRLYSRAGCKTGEPPDGPMCVEECRKGEVEVALRGVYVDSLVRVHR